MLNDQNLIICNNCNNIVCDARTLLPGYLTVSNGVITKYNSIDPNNKHLSTPHDPRYDLPKNRMEGENGESYVVSELVKLDGVEAEKLKDADFCSEICLRGSAKPS